MPQHEHLTQLLNDWRTGDEHLIGDIVPAVYDELHRLARSYMRNQPAHHTLQATALINEAFIRLDSIDTKLENRGHFIAIVANLMRQILVDHARAKASLKRGGDVHKVSLEDSEHPATDAPSIDVLALESVLESLEHKQPRKVRIAELYYFCGTTYKETAEALDISEATLHRELRMLRALLAKRLAAP